MERTGGRSFVWYPVVLVAGLAGALVGYLCTFLLYVLVGEALFYFLSLCFIALLAALCAVFAGSALAGGGRGVRLWSVVGVGQAAAVLAALANIAFADAVSLSEIGLGRQMPANAAVLAAVCGVAAWVLRRPPAAASSSEAKDGRSAALLVALALVLMVAGVVIYDFLNPGG